MEVIQTTEHHKINGERGRKWGGKSRGKGGGEICPTIQKKESQSGGTQETIFLFKGGLRIQNQDTAKVTHFGIHVHTKVMSCQVTK